MSRANRKQWGWAVPGLLVVAPAFSANVEWLPNYAITALYSDNYLLNAAPSPKIKVTGGELEVGAQLKSSSLVSTVEFNGSVTANYLPGDSELQTVGYVAGLDMNHRGQKSYAGFHADYGHTGVVSSELARAGLNNPAGGLGGTSTTDTGRASGRNYRNQLVVAPEFRVDLSERWQAGVEASYLDVDYTRVVLGDQVDFKRALGRVGLAYQFSQTGTLSLQASGGGFRPGVGNGKGNLTGVSLRITSQWAPNSQGYAQLGSVRANPDNPLQAAKSNWVGGIGVQRALQVGSIYADLTRTVDGNAAGVIVARDELRLTVSRPFSQRVLTYFSAVGIQDRAAMDLPILQYRPRKYAQAAVGMEWKASREHSIKAEYVHAWQSFSGNSADAHSNGFRISFAYTPLSRESR